MYLKALTVLAAILNASLAIDDNEPIIPITDAPEANTGFSDCMSWRYCSGQALCTSEYIFELYSSSPTAETCPPSFEPVEGRYCVSVADSFCKFISTEDLIESCPAACDDANHEYYHACWNLEMCYMLLECKDVECERPQCDIGEEFKVTMPADVWQGICCDQGYCEKVDCGAHQCDDETVECEYPYEEVIIIDDDACCARKECHIPQCDIDSDCEDDDACIFCWSPHMLEPIRHCQPVQNTYDSCDLDLGNCGEGRFCGSNDFCLTTEMNVEVQSGICCPILDCEICTGDDIPVFDEHGCPTCECQEFNPCADFGGMVENTFCLNDGDCQSNKCDMALLEIGFCCQNGPAPTICKDGVTEYGTDCTCTTEGCSFCKLATSDEPESCLRCHESHFDVDGECIAEYECKNGVRGDGQDCTCDVLDSCNGHCYITPAGPSRCVECKDGKFLNDGACVDSCPLNKAPISPPGSTTGRFCQEDVQCWNGKAKKGGAFYHDWDCECQEFCKQCYYSDAEEGTKCTECRAGRFMDGDQCTDTCPADKGPIMPPGSKFGRFCQENVRCWNKNAKKKGEFYHDWECRCPLGCKQCYFSNPNYGTTCVECGSGYFMQDGTCVQRCDEQYSHYGYLGSGRQCVQPFQCVDGVSSLDGSPCECPPQTGKGCTSCAFEANNRPKTATCLNCSDSLLQYRSCVKSCKEGFEDDGNGICRRAQ